MTTYPPLDSLVRIASEGGVGTIELARPEVHNCITPSMLRTIGEAIHRFEEDCTVRAVVVAAAGRNFCTGADLAEIGPICADEGRMRDFLRTAHDTMDTIERSPLPVIAAVQGFCLAGGLELALACDVLIASEDAVFGDQHVV